MSALGTLLVMLASLLTMFQAAKTGGVLYIVGLWLIYHG